MAAQIVFSFRDAERADDVHELLIDLSDQTGLIDLVDSDTATADQLDEVELGSRGDPGHLPVVLPEGHVALFLLVGRTSWGPLLDRLAPFEGHLLHAELPSEETRRLERLVREHRSSPRPADYTPLEKADALGGQPSDYV